MNVFADHEGAASSSGEENNSEVVFGVGVRGFDVGLLNHLEARRDGAIWRSGVRAR